MECKPTIIRSSYSLSENKEIKNSVLCLQCYCMHTHNYIGPIQENCHTLKTLTTNMIVFEAVCKKGYVRRSIFNFCLHANI